MKQGPSRSKILPVFRRWKILKAENLVLIDTKMNDTYGTDLKIWHTQL